MEAAVDRDCTGAWRGAPERRLESRLDLMAMSLIDRMLGHSPAGNRNRDVLLELRNLKSEGTLQNYLEESTKHKDVQVPRMDHISVK